MRTAPLGAYRKLLFRLDLVRRTKSAKSGGSERIGLRRAIFGRLRAGAVNRSAPISPGNLPLSAAAGLAESAARMGTGGGGATRYRRSPGWSLGEGRRRRR